MKRRTRTTPTKKSAKDSGRALAPNYVVGIGASAGGLEALRSLFGALKKPNRMAFVVVQHLAPTYRSRLVELIAHTTELPVKEVSARERLRAGVIYITPPNKDVYIKNQTLELTRPSEKIGPKPSIDRFLHSLAEDQRERAIGVILSGTGTDGAEGIQSVKAEGGYTLIQKPESAKYDGMPKAAQKTERIDSELTPEEIAKALEKYSGPGHPGIPADDGKAAKGESPYENILRLVESETGTNFSDYKPGTIQRRIERRVSATHSQTLPRYLEYIRRHPDEIDNLHQDVLISVTHFFRDGALFRSLELRLTQLIRSKPKNYTIRAWIVGCATGEEAYSVAILISEICEKLGRHLGIQLFATDLDEQALSVARKGIYEASSLGDVPKKLQEKYFAAADGKFRVKQTLRDCVIFARHNVTQDPPFLNLDLVTCRNLLIYFNADLQHKVFQTFHYALAPKGTLFLGKSENVPESLGLFTNKDKRSRVYTRVDRRGDLPHSGNVGERQREARLISKERSESRTDDFFSSLISSLAPDSILIDTDQKVRHVYGEAGRFLNIGSGEVTHSLTKLLVDPFNVEVGSLVHRANKLGQVTKGKVQESVRGESLTRTQVTVAPLFQGNQKFLLVSFDVQTQPLGQAEKVPNAPMGMDKKLRQTEDELKSTREHLQTLVEEQETSNEELQSLNEELQSANEELQSANEELETSNEELQSTNEELTTVNQELNVKSTELQMLNQTLQAIQGAMIYPLIVVDPKLKLLSLNPAAKFLFRVGENDIGHYLKTIPFQVEMAPIIAKLDESLRKGTENVLQFQTRERSFEVQIQIFRDAKNQPAGAVVSFVDNTEITRAFEQMGTTKRRLANILDNTPAIVLMKDTTGVITFANRRFCEVTGLEEAEVLGATDEDLFGAELGGQIRERDFEVIKRRKPIQYEEKLVLKDKSHWWASSRFPLTDDKKRVQAVCTISLDISDRIMHRRQLEIFKQAISSVMAGIVIFEDSKQGSRATFVNEEIHKTLGLEPGGIRGLNLHQALERFFPHKKADQIKELGHQIQANPNWSVVVDLPRHASSFQEEKWMELRSSHLRESDGTKKQIILTIFDATQRVIDQRVITQQQDELTKFSRYSALGEISAGIAHEINTPLNVVTTKTDILRRMAQKGQVDTANVLRLSADIDQMAKNISSIVMGLKSLAAPDSTLSENVDLGRLIRDTLKICEFRLHRVGVDLKLRLPSHEVRVDCFPVQISQILINLVNNSLDAIASRPERWIEIELKEEGRGVSIAVTDCGEGIEESLSEKIMTPFFTTKKDKKGTGIGLSLSRTIARNHGGELGLDRKRPHTSFRLDLPKRQAAISMKDGKP